MVSLSILRSLKGVKRIYLFIPRKLYLCGFVNCIVDTTPQRYTFPGFSYQSVRTEEASWMRSPVAFDSTCTWIPWPGQLRTFTNSLLSVVQDAATLQYRETKIWHLWQTVLIKHSTAIRCIHRSALSINCSISEWCEHTLQVFRTMATKEPQNTDNKTVTLPVIVSVESRCLKGDKPFKPTCCSGIRSIGVRWKPERVRKTQWQDCSLSSCINLIWM